MSRLLETCLSSLFRVSPFVCAWLLVPSEVSAAVTTVSVPEPASAILVATGIAGMVLEARRRRK